MGYGYVGDAETSQINKLLKSIYSNITLQNECRMQERVISFCRLHFIPQGDGIVCDIHMILHSKIHNYMHYEK